MFPAISGFFAAMGISAGISIVVIIMTFFGVKVVVGVLNDGLVNGKATVLHSEHEESDLVINKLKNKGIISNTENVGYNSEISRAELLKMLMRVKRIFPSNLTYSNCFDDVKTEWFAPEVCFAKEKGWVNGNGNFFNPDLKISYGEAREIIRNMFGNQQSYFGENDAEKNISRLEAYNVLVELLS